MINKFISYRTHVEKGQTDRAPKRILFFRTGVSEGQFKQVLEKELPLIKGLSGTSADIYHSLIQDQLEACEATKISPKITVIVVGRRHHVRFFPAPNVADRSGNCPAGTVVDTDVVHPTEFDFYLQSHGGLLGTSRSAHYSVLSDENGFSWVFITRCPPCRLVMLIPRCRADGLQTLTFALCHVYARATRSVSIPAPIYCEWEYPLHQRTFC